MAFNIGGGGVGIRDVRQQRSRAGGGEQLGICLNGQPNSVQPGVLGFDQALANLKKLHQIGLPRLIKPLHAGGLLFKRRGQRGGLPRKPPRFVAANQRGFDLRNDLLPDLFERR